MGVFPSLPDTEVLQSIWNEDYGNHEHKVYTNFFLIIISPKPYNNNIKQARQYFLFKNKILV